MNRRHYGARLHDHVVEGYRAIALENELLRVEVLAPSSLVPLDSVVPASVSLLVPVLVSTPVSVPVSVPPSSSPVSALPAIVQ